MYQDGTELSWYESQLSSHLVIYHLVNATLPFQVRGRLNAPSPVAGNPSRGTRSWPGTRGSTPGWSPSPAMFPAATNLSGGRTTWRNIWRPTRGWRVPTLVSRPSYFIILVIRILAWLHWHRVGSSKSYWSSTYKNYHIVNSVVWIII